jgi:hypothetical protein
LTLKTSTDTVRRAIGDFVNMQHDMLSARARRARSRLSSPGLCAAAAVALLITASCASDSSAPATSAADRGTREQPVGGGSLFDQIEAKRQAQRERGAKPAVDLNAGAGDVPAAWRAKIDSSWKLFLKDDPGWPAARQEWIALGPAAVNILVENLIRVYILAHDAGDGPVWHRAREELAEHKDVAIPYLVEGLAGKNKADSVVRNLCSELLAYLGEPAVPYIERAWSDSDADGRAALARALKKMQSRSSIPLLIRIAGGPDPFNVRIEAIDTLGRLGAKEAVPVMRDCLKDADPSVRKFAATWISELGEATRPVFESLIAALEAAVRNGEPEIARACVGSLKRLSGRNLGNDPRAWRDALPTLERASGRKP